MATQLDAYVLKDAEWLLLRQSDPPEEPDDDPLIE